jgi:hypothetical protein
MADIADIGFKVDTAQLDAAKAKVAQLFRTVEDQVKSTDKVTVAVNRLTQRVDSGNKRQVEAHGRTRKAVEANSNAIRQLTDRTESGTKRQVAAHRRTVEAVERAATQAAKAAQQQVRAFNSVEEAIRRQNLVLNNTAMQQLAVLNQLVQSVDRLSASHQRVSISTRRVTTDTGGLITQQRTLRDQLLGTANAIAVLDGPLGGVASRFSSLGVLMGRFGLAGAGIAVAMTTLTVASTKAVSVFAEMETAFLRLERLAENLQDSFGAAGVQLQGMINRIAFDTLESVETVSGAVMNVMGLQSITAANIERVVRLSADMAAAGMSDIGSAATALAKALDDPERALSQLNRRFQVFSSDEMNVIQMMNRMGRQAEAQEAIFSRMEGVVGGLSETYGGLSGNMDTIRQGTQTFFREFGGYITATLQLESATGLLANALRRYSENVDRSRGIFPLGPDAQENLKFLREELDKAEQQFIRTSRTAREFGDSYKFDPLAFAARELLGVRGLLPGDVDRDFEKVSNISKQIEAIEKAESERNKRIQQRIGLVQREIELQKERLNMSGTDTEFRAFAMSRGVPIRGPNESQQAFNGRLPDGMSELQQWELEGLTRQAFEQRGFDKMISDRESMVSALQDQTLGAQILAEDFDNLSSLPKIIQDAEILYQKLLRSGEVDETSESMKELRRSIEQLVEAQGPLDLAQSARAFDAAVKDGNESLQVTLNNLRLAEASVEMTAGQRARESALQKVINDATIKGRLTDEQVLELRKELVVEAAETLSLIEQQADATEARLEKERALAGITGIRDNAESTLRSLQAQTVVMAQLGVKTEENSVLYDAMVSAVAEQLRLQGDNVDLAGELSDEIQAAVDGTYAAASAAQVLANNMANANAQAAAYASTLRSVSSGVISDEDRALQVREVLRLRQQGLSVAEAEAQALGAVYRAQFERTRQQVSSQEELVRVLAQEEESIRKAVQARREAGMATEALAEFEKALRDSMKETTDKSGEELQRRIDQSTQAIQQMIATLDPAAAAALALARDIETLNEALELGVVSAEEHIAIIGALTEKYREAQDPVAKFYAELVKLQDPELFKLDALQAAQKSLADFLFDPFEDGVRGMVKSFVDALRRMLAEAIAANLMQRVMGQMGMGPQSGPQAGAAALNSAGILLQGSGRALSGSALALNQAAAALAAGGQGANLTALAGIGAPSPNAAGSNFLSSLLGPLFGGFFDAGGYLPPGKVGIAGERGPELIAGPASITGRRETAQAMAPARPQVNQKIINVLDPSIVSDYLSSGEGEEIVLNVLKRNGLAG